MITNPRVGQVVRLAYAPAKGGNRKGQRNPLHGSVCVVLIVSRGRPRNHGVEVDGTLYAIPCGNMMREASREH